MTSGTDIYNALQTPTAGTTAAAATGASRKNGEDQDTKGLFGQYLSEESQKSDAPAQKKNETAGTSQTPPEQNKGETKASSVTDNQAQSVPAKETSADGSPADKASEDTTVGQKEAEQSSDNLASAGDSATATIMQGRTKDPALLDKSGNNPLASPQEVEDVDLAKTGDAVSEKAESFASSSPEKTGTSDKPALPEADPIPEKAAASQSAAVGNETENTPAGKDGKTDQGQQSIAPAPENSNTPENGNGKNGQHAEIRVSKEVAIENGSSSNADHATSDAGKTVKHKGTAETADQSDTDHASTASSAANKTAEDTTLAAVSSQTEVSRETSETAAAARDIPAGDNAKVPTSGDKSAGSQADNQADTPQQVAANGTPAKNGQDGNGRDGNGQKDDRSQKNEAGDGRNMAASGTGEKEAATKSSAKEQASAGGQAEQSTAKPAGEQFFALQKLPLDGLNSRTASYTLNLNMGHQLVVGAHGLAIQETTASGLQHTGSAPQNTALASQAASEQIVAAVSRHMNAGKSTFRIQLNPAELGQVDVKMEFASDGKMMTTLTVDNERTLHLLQRDQGSLGKMLENAGFDMNQGNLNFSLRQQAGNDTGFGRPDGSYSSDGDLQSEDEQVPAEILSVNVTDSGLDISV
ncbi:flagellar hook-length control protein FliK [Emcibacter sp.]|uniref:flagellar hook-length control protein FliK n=1 Tax=Emcibacter sp. TaxID=1979954 RepID=UPI002AA8608F|nr:flagellar hook-length control protein FliK [Emcibacter sp.]